MQLLPNKLYLAMNAAMFIAYNGDVDNPVSGVAIVDYCGLNRRALEPVLQRLAGEGIIISIKGAKGGYYMPNQDIVTLRDIAEAFIDKAFPDRPEFSGYNSLLDKELEGSYSLWLESLSKSSFDQLCDRARDIDNLEPIADTVLHYDI